MSCPTPAEALHSGQLEESAITIGRQLRIAGAGHLTRNGL